MSTHKILPPSLEPEATDQQFNAAMRIEYLKMAGALTVLFLCLLVALLTGCATWTHPTKTASAWDADLYECEKDAAAAPASRALEMKQRCMRLKGWRAQ